MSDNNPIHPHFSRILNAFIHGWLDLSEALEEADLQDEKVREQVFLSVEKYSTRYATLLSEQAERLYHNAETPRKVKTQKWDARASAPAPVKAPAKAPVKVPVEAPEAVPADDEDDLKIPLPIIVRQSTQQQLYTFALLTRLTLEARWPGGALITTVQDVASQHVMLTGRGVGRSMSIYTKPQYGLLRRRSDLGKIAYEVLPRGEELFTYLEERDLIPAWDVVKTLIERKAAR